MFICLQSFNYLIMGRGLRLADCTVRHTHTHIWGIPFLEPIAQFWSKPTPKDQIDRYHDLSGLIPVLLLFTLCYKHFEDHVKMNISDEIRLISLMLVKFTLQQHKHTSKVLFLPACWVCPPTLRKRFSPATCFSLAIFHFILYWLHTLAAATCYCEFNMLKMKGITFSKM